MSLMIMNFGENQLRSGRERQWNNSGGTGSETGREGFHYSFHVSNRMIKKTLRRNAKPDMP